jgi:predicted nuclease with TOPRIM domain
MKRKTLPEIIKGLEPLSSNVKRIRTKVRKSLWDELFASLESGDSFEIEALEVNTVKAHAEKHGFELRHKKTEGTTVIAQVHKALAE